jgi:serine/threonine protein kinase
MSYLEGKGIVHRDLALRNLLVSGSFPNYVVKVSDFGLSKMISESGYYRSDSKAIPFKWAAPEVLLKGFYSHKV